MSDFKGHDNCEPSSFKIKLRNLIKINSTLDFLALIMGLNFHLRPTSALITEVKT